MRIDRSDRRIETHDFKNPKNPKENKEDMNPRNPRYPKSGVRSNTLKDRSRKYPKTLRTLCTPANSGLLHSHAVDLAQLSTY